MRLQNIERLQKLNHLLVTRKGYEAIGPINFLEFNLRKKPFSDVRVRRAIYHAIDREFITKKLHQGLSIKATGPLVHAFPSYTDKVKQNEYNLDEANKILDEAGYPRDSNGVRFLATLDWYPGDYDNQQMIAEYLKPQLKKIGIDIELRPPSDFGTWIKRVASWEHDLSMNAIYSYGDPVIGVHRLYICENIKHVIWTNTAGYCNPKVDEILAEASSEMDVKKRNELYAQFQEILNEDVPLAWTHELPYYSIYHKDLRNPPMGIWGANAPFDKIYWKDGKAPK
jgi:peptide/nickel transport system substrate-binding protein